VDDRITAWDHPL
jgi:uncharacterized membrane protein